MLTLLISFYAIPVLREQTCSKNVIFMVINQKQDYFF